MRKIELTEKEVPVLIEMLESFLSDLQTERVGTDNREWHAQFVERETLINNVINQLKK